MTIGSLFSGVGALDLALEALGLGPVLWQAESNAYCRTVLAQHWPRARRYERVEDIDEHVPRVRLLAGGFPCQDVSNAGLGAGLDGARSGLWYEYVRCIRLLRPALVFVENVPGLIGHLGRVLGPLAALGFHAEWDVFSAAQCGAPHLRERLFILAAHPDRLRKVESQSFTWREGQAVAYADGAPWTATDANCGGLERRGESDRARGWSQPPDRGSAAADTHGDGQLQPQGREQEQRRWSRDSAPGDAADASGERREDGRRGEGSSASRWRVERQAEFRRRLEGCRRAWRSPLAGVRGVDDGASTRLDACRRRARLHALGNAVVPQEAELAFVKLAQRAGLAGDIWVQPEEARA